MENNDIKQNIAKNISELRKANKLTQLELAEKLNYSDKAISRWERGDTLPDIDILCKICELFGVTFEYLINANNKEEIQKTTRVEVGNRLTITLLAISVVWFVATFIYVYCDIILSLKLWQVFVYAVPTSALVAQVFNGMWGERKYSVFILSVLVWTFLASIYIATLQYNLWLVFILGIPLQVLVLLWARLKPRNKNRD
ncbi:MAG: helix-turn-helix domain-containing protein [Christensenellales bacterium]